MVALLAYQPGMKAGFEPILTAVSLLLAILGIGFSVALSVGQQQRDRRFAAGLVLGLAVTALHYVGQDAYLVTGQVVWNKSLVVSSVLTSLGMFGLSMVIAGERSRATRRLAAPLLLGSIAFLHLCGMAAATLTFDPRVELPLNAVAPSTIAPIIAAVCFALLSLAFVGLRMTLNAKARRWRDKERLRELASLSLEGLAVCDNGLITTANQSLERLSGMKQADLSGYSVFSLLPGLMISSVPEQEERDAELMTADGQLVPVRVLRKEVTLGDKPQTVIAIRDQRERLRTEARIRSLAYSDALTGLPNRARLGDLIAQQVAIWRENGRDLAVLLIDLDRFKLINDTRGHGIGDALLRKVAARIRSTIGESDVVARLGGDEFAVIQTGFSEANESELLACRIVEAIGRPFLLDGHPVNIGASVGIALPTGTGDPDELLRNADLAMYLAKAEGKGTFRMFKPAMAERMEARRALEADMRQAVEAGAFELHYQPVVQVSSGAVTGAEALIRWRHPKHGLISPADFIPLAEETGLISPLSEWVLREACMQAMTWPGEIKVAVNLSPVQFRNDRLPEVVMAALAARGLPARGLELEITEGVMLDDEERTLAILVKLKAANVGIAMDDFGTGYASLSYLRRFPFDKLKVDRSFVHQLPGDSESAAIVRAILTMGACLGVATTVEGVETAEQYAFVAAERCEQVQGYYISPPLPAAEFLAFVTTMKRAA